jgi:tetratricopeptide (TPR) repeat protein
MTSFARRLVQAVALFAGGLAVAAIVLYALRSPVTNQYGYALLGAGEFAEAVEHFQAVAERSPDEPNPWDSLGEGYLANAMPDKALDAYSRALAIEPTFEASILGRGLALAALGRYEEALERPSPDFRVQAFLLSRVGRYREATEVLDRGRRDETDAEVTAVASLTAAWLFVEQKQYARALDEVRTARAALADRENHSLLVLADLVGGIAEIRAGNVRDADVRLASRKTHYDRDDPVESNWVAAFDGEVALAQGRYEQALSSFAAAQKKAWLALGRDASTVFSIGLPSRDGAARVESARGNRSAAVEQYRRLTAGGTGNWSAAALEPRHILELARLLSEQGDAAAASVEYARFLKLWANADAGLPELVEARRALAGHPVAGPSGR